MHPRVRFSFFVSARARLTAAPSAIMFALRIKTTRLLFSAGARSLRHHDIAQLRAAEIFKSARFPPSSARAPAPPLWGGAIFPEAVYGEPRAEVSPHADIANIAYNMFALVRCMGASCHHDYLESLGELSALDECPPVDRAMGGRSWSIGADEELGPSHPCVAIAYFQRLALAERRLHESQAWNVSAEAIEPLGMRLALAMMGDPEALCGISPAWMERFDESLFAATRLRRTFESAQLILPLLSERRALSANISQPPSHARAARL